MLYVTWFAAGLRMIDISDPVNPREKGYFIPQPAEGRDVPWTNDVAKDEPRADLLHRQGLRPRRHRIRQLMRTLRSTLKPMDLITVP